MKENKKYTAAEIERYHAGKMSMQEMHAIEKAALQDPFLADALEGYTHTPHFEKDLQEIRQRLIEKRKQEKVFSIFSLTGNGWWRVAALVVIIAGAGYFFYHSNDVKKDNLLTRNEPQTVPGKADTAAVNKDSAATNSVAFENNKVQTGLNKKAAEANNHLAEVDKRKSPISLTGKNIKSNSLADSNTARAEMNKENASQSANEYVLAGKLTDQQGRAVPFATITDKKNKTATVTDTSGNFFIRSQDSSTTAIASAAGYVSKNILLKRDEQPTIEMKKLDDESDQVVVTAMGVSKKAKAAAPELKALSGKVSGIQITTIHPSEGQEKFDQYLQINLRPVYNENHERLTGEVQLSFTLNKKGHPENIRVVKSSCVACDKEATRLLQNGPIWIGKKGEAGSVVIKF